MRISDWSSDVCSSDLPIFREEVAILGRIGQQCANFLSHRLKSPANHRREPVVIESETLIRVGIEVFDDPGATPDEGGFEPIFLRASHRGKGSRPQLEIGRASCRERVFQYV